MPTGIIHKYHQSHMSNLHSFSPRTRKPSSPQTCGNIVVLFVVRALRYCLEISFSSVHLLTLASVVEADRKTEENPIQLKPSLLLFRMQMSPSAMRKLVFYGEAFI